MSWTLTPYTLPFAGAAVITVLVAAFVYRRKEKQGAVPLLGILAAIFVWSIADGIRLSTTEQTLKVMMYDVQFFGHLLVTVSVFLFAAAYTNRSQWLEPRRVAALFAVHVVTFLLVWTNQYHHLIREGVTMYQTGGGYFLLDIQWGPWYYIHVAYSYLLLVGTAAMFLDRLRQSGNVRTFRTQTLSVLVAQFVPWGLNIAFNAGLTEVDLTALGFTVTGTMFALALVRYRILDLVPIARSTVVDNINQGYIVLNTDDTIVDVNETTVEITGIGRDTLVGLDVNELYSDYPDVIERFRHAYDDRDQIEMGLDGETRYYDVDISPIYDQHNHEIGRVILFRDITEQEQRKRQLEQQKTKLEHQNERLEEFASIVSHDLRNPINVIQGSVELARRNPADEHLDSIESSVKRMEAIVDDVLSMARQGRTVEETEPVDLHDLAEDAWDNVDTKQATKEFTTDRTVQGDRNRLLQVFENLFRNAIDHGRDDVTIRVGDLEDGFYVEDDGPGIPEDERDDIFEKGYTTVADGTGLGLAIAKTAVEAHGWTIEVLEGSAGGARFEVTGVTPFVSVP